MSISQTLRTYGSCSLPSRTPYFSRTSRNTIWCERRPLSPPLQSLPPPAPRRNTIQHIRTHHRRKPRDSYRVTPSPPQPPPSIQLQTTQRMKGASETNIYCRHQQQPPTHSDETFKKHNCSYPNYTVRHRARTAAPVVVCCIPPHIHRHTHSHRIYIHVIPSRNIQNTHTHDTLTHLQNQIYYICMFSYLLH